MGKYQICIKLGALNMFCSGSGVLINWHKLVAFWIGKSRVSELASFNEFPMDS